MEKKTPKDRYNKTLSDPRFGFGKKRKNLKDTNDNKKLDKYTFDSLKGKEGQV